jgi:hypothetical protein
MWDETCTRNSTFMCGKAANFQRAELTCHMYHASSLRTSRKSSFRKKKKGNIRTRVVSQGQVLQTCCVTLRWSKLRNKLQRVKVRLEIETVKPKYVSSIPGSKKCFLTRRLCLPLSEFSSRSCVSNGSHTAEVSLPIRRLVLILTPSSVIFLGPFRQLLEYGLKYKSRPLPNYLHFINHSHTPIQHYMFNPHNRRKSLLK